MAAKQQGRKFTANVKVTVIVGVDLTARTLEDALIQAREIKWSDCIETVGETVDYTQRLIGVSSDEWLRE